MALRALERRRLIAEMNLIPLIDVALILVIIFMILTPALIQSQLTVKLPHASSGEPPPSETTIRVEVTRTGMFLLDGRPVQPAALERELAMRLSSAAKKSVLVQADRSVPVEKVVFVLDAARKLGAGRIGIGVANAR